MAVHKMNVDEMSYLRVCRRVRRKSEGERRKDKKWLKFKMTKMIFYYFFFVLKYNDNEVL